MLLTSPILGAANILASFAESARLLREIIQGFIPFEDTRDRSLTGFTQMREDGPRLLEVYQVRAGLYARLSVISPLATTVSTQACLMALMVSYRHRLCTYKPGATQIRAQRHPHADPGQFWQFAIPLRFFNIPNLYYF